MPERLRQAQWTDSESWNLARMSNLIIRIVAIINPHLPGGEACGSVSALWILICRHPIRLVRQFRRL